PGRGAVTPPELPAGSRGPRGEVGLPEEAGQPGRVEILGVPEDDRTRRRAVAAPELVVVGAEEERAVDVGQLGREGAVGSDAQVRDAGGAGGCAVALPQPRGR